MSVVQLAKSVKEALNENVGLFSKQFEAVRGWMPKDEAKGLTSNLRLIVGSGPVATEANSRQTTLKNATVFICTLCRLEGCTTTDDKGDLTPLDELIDFVEGELQAFFVNDSGEPIIVDDAWEATSVTADPVYDPDAAEKGVFQSVLRVEFQRTEGAC